MPDLIISEEPRNQVITEEPVTRVIKSLQAGPQGAPGDDGAPGAAGPQGPQGDPGVGVPTGGTTGQVLAKDTNADYDTEWIDAPGGAVDSVNGQTGVVVLDQDDIADGVTAKQYTATDKTKLDHITVTQAVNLDTMESDIAAKQPLDSDLTAIAGLTPSNDDFIQRKAGAWANRTIAQIKTDLAIDQVSNTSDANKPVSTAQQTALNTKQDLDATLTAVAALTATGFVSIGSSGAAASSRVITAGSSKIVVSNGNGSSGNPTIDLGTLSKADVGLTNVDNTSDANKPVSSAQQTALDLKENVANKDTDGTLAANSDTKYASQKATKTYADTKLPSSYLDTDGTLAANSDTKIASQKAIVTYAKKRTGQGTGKVDGFAVRDYRILGNAYLNGVTTNTPSTNRWTFEFYDVTEPITLDRVGIEVTTAGAAGKLVRLALYTADQYLQPGTLIQDFGTVATDVGAVPTLQTITINLTLQPGRYIGIVTQDGAAAFRVITAFHLAGNALTAGTGTSPYRNITSLGGAGTVSGGYASVNPKWERDVYSGSGATQYFMKFREVV